MPEKTGWVDAQGREPPPEKTDNGRFIYPEPTVTRILLLVLAVTSLTADAFPWQQRQQQLQGMPSPQNTWANYCANCVKMADGLCGKNRNRDKRDHPCAESVAEHCSNAAYECRLAGQGFLSRFAPSQRGGAAVAFRAESSECAGPARNGRHAFHRTTQPGPDGSRFERSFQHGFEHSGQYGQFAFYRVERRCYASAQSARIGGRWPLHGLFSAGP